MDLFGRLFEFVTTVFSFWAAWITGVVFVIEQGVPYLPKRIGEWIEREWPKESRYPALRMLCVLGLVLASFQAFDQANGKLKEANNKLAADDTIRELLTYRWPPLSAQEAVAIKSAFNGFQKVELAILCNFAGCSDLAASLETVFEDIHWTVTSGPGMGATVSGFQIWSASKQTPKFAEAIELATKGRIKPSIHMKAQEGEGELDEQHLMFAVGRKR
jgi:hypothetical protein